VGLVRKNNLADLVDRYDAPAFTRYGILHVSVIYQHRYVIPQHRQLLAAQRLSPSALFLGIAGARVNEAALPSLERRSPPSLRHPSFRLVSQGFALLQSLRAYVETEEERYHRLLRSSARLRGARRRRGFSVLGRISLLRSNPEFLRHGFGGDRGGVR
jgi:hypothetical protein